MLSAAHARIGLTFALVTSIPGLFWGGIFARTPSRFRVSFHDWRLYQQRDPQKAYRLAGP